MQTAKERLLFGYILKNGIYVVEHEKAVINQLYVINKGVSAFDTEEWSLVGIEKKKFLQYSKTAKNIPEKFRIPLISWPRSLASI